GQVGDRVRPADSDLPFSLGDGVRLILPPDEVMELYLLKWEIVVRGPSLSPNVEPYWQYLVETFEDMVPFLIILTVFTGVLLITIIYNLIVAVSLRSASYLYYGLYLVSILLINYFVIADNVIPSLSPFANDMREGIKSLGLNSAVLFYLLFGRHFVNSSELTPKWDPWLKALIGIRIALVVANVIILIVSPDALANSFYLNVWLLAEVVFILLYLVKLIRLKSTVLWFFIIGSILVFFLGFAPVILGMFANGNDGALLLLALLLEILVFSLGLGYKVRQQQRDKLAAEQSLNQELQKVNTAFGRFVPHAFIESLGHQSVLDVKLGDQVEKEVTVLFSDIRGYTTLAEGMTPQQNFDFLNAYLGRMGPIIQAHHGFVNQYYGDGIMALFLKHPNDAIRAAEDMQRELAQYNESRAQRGRVPLRIGIGIHTGPLMMGIIGDTLRLEAGVVSDTVNTAARMEGLTKYFGVNVLLSEPTWGTLSAQQRTDLRCLGQVMVKGRKQATEIYQSFSGEAPAIRAVLSQQTSSFEQALQAYLNRDFTQALAQFEAIQLVMPEDLPTQYYLRLTRQHLMEGVPDDWDGVERMLVK
ncbi:MAG: adenylate/guanylate cyclase domain-containing protein, partial [Bacteroidota bacterium]